MLTPVLYIIRHGRTSLNIANKFRGDIDVSLAPVGRKDAQDSVDFLLDHEQIEPDFLVSSDRKRAVETADIIRKTFPIEHTITKDLRAWSLGDFSGQPKNKENLDKLENYVQNPDEQIPNGESLNDFRNRILPALAECYEYATRNGIGLIVVHSSVIHEIGTQIHGSHSALVVEPGGIVVIGFDNGSITGERIFKPLEKVENTASVS